MKRFVSAAILPVVAFSLIFSLSCKKEESNNNPTVTSVTVTPPTSEPGAPVLVNVVAADPDGDQLSYSYTVTGGAIQGSGASANWTAPSIPGNYSVTVTVSDGKGGTASGNGSLVVEAPATQILGTAGFPAGTSGDLSNAKVSLYTSYDNWVNNQPVKFTTAAGSGAEVTFTLSDLNPGNYYLDVWKDNDNNGSWSPDDFVGWYGQGGLGSPDLTEIQIAEGETITVSIQMYIIEGTNTSVTGTATLDAGTTGDLANSIVGLYATINDFLMGNPVAATVATGSGTSVTFEFTGVDEGSYYVGIWKDSDGNSTVSGGDFLGWYGSGTLDEPNPVPVDVAVDAPVTANMTVFLIPIVEPTTTISGSATIADGTTGDLVNTYVFLYSSYDNYVNFVYDNVVVTTGSGATVMYAFGAVDPGAYYMDAWTDADGSEDFNEGDYYGVYEDLASGYIDEITLNENDMLELPIPMYMITGKSNDDIQNIRKTIKKK